MKRGKYRGLRQKRIRNWLHLLIFVFFLLFFSGIAYSLSPGFMDVTGNVHIRPTISDNIPIPPITTPTAITIPSP